jgi:glycosyltransferase involved in cell wall biosynthesis
MRIAMLSQNESRHDSRVIREAEALARLGHDVTVVCRSNDGHAVAHEMVSGVNYAVVPRRDSVSASALLALFRAHALVLLFDVQGVGRRRPGLRGFRSSARLIGLLAALPVGAFVFGLLKLKRGRASRVLRRPRLADYLEALRYTNDFAAWCTDLVVALEPDVVHAHDLITLSGGAIAARSAGAQLVYDAHELETHTNYHSLSPTTKRWIADYEAALTTCCDAVVTVCDSIADWLADAYRIPRPIVVMNAPRRPHVATSRSVRRELDLPPTTSLVVYIGSVTVDRGLEKTVIAMKHLPEVHFATVGWRYAETENAMRRLAVEHGVADRLHFVDPVPTAEVVSFVSDADASVIAIQNVCLSYAFCFPNKLLESVFAGLPVAAANLVELRRFLEAHPVGLLMDETDPEAIAATLTELITRRKEFVPDERELEAIERTYGWDAQEARLGALYRQLEALDARDGVQPRRPLTNVAS